MDLIFVKKSISPSLNRHDERYQIPKYSRDFTTITRLNFITTTMTGYYVSQMGIIQNLIHYFSQDICRHQEQ